MIGPFREERGKPSRSASSIWVFQICASVEEKTGDDGEIFIYTASSSNRETCCANYWASMPLLAFPFVIRHKRSFWNFQRPHGDWARSYQFRRSFQTDMLLSTVILFHAERAISWVCLCCVLIARNRRRLWGLGDNRQESEALYCSRPTSTHEYGLCYFRSSRAPHIESFMSILFSSVDKCLSSTCSWNCFEIVRSLQRNHKIAI